MRSNSDRIALLTKFKNKEYRQAFVDANIGDTISSQIFALRKRERLSQTQLAEACGMAQARISVLENPGYASFSISTLKRLAAAFDVALVVKFVAFSELLSSLDQLSPETVNVPSFDEEEVFKTQPLVVPIAESSQDSGNDMDQKAKRDHGGHPTCVYRVHRQATHRRYPAQASRRMRLSPSEGMAYCLLGLGALALLAWLCWQIGRIG